MILKNNFILEYNMRITALPYYSTIKLFTTLLDNINYTSPLSAENLKKALYIQGTDKQERKGNIHD